MSNIGNNKPVNTVNKPKKTKFDEEYEKYDKIVADTITDIQSNYKTIMTDSDINNRTKRFMAKLIQLIAYHNTMIKAMYESRNNSNVDKRIKELEKKIVEDCKEQQKVYKEAEDRLSNMYSKFITTNPNTVKAIQLAQSSKFRTNSPRPPPFNPTSTTPSFTPPTATPSATPQYRNNTRPNRPPSNITV